MNTIQWPGNNWPLTVVAVNGNPVVLVDMAGAVGFAAVTGPGAAGAATVFDANGIGYPVMLPGVHVLGGNGFRVQF